MVKKIFFLHLIKCLSFFIAISPFAMRFYNSFKENRKVNWNASRNLAISNWESWKRKMLIANRAPQGKTLRWGKSKFNHWVFHEEWRNEREITHFLLLVPCPLFPCRNDLDNRRWWNFSDSVSGYFFLSLSFPSPRLNVSWFNKRRLFWRLVLTSATWKNQTVFNSQTISRA